jgi:hypothetical protein
MLGQQALDMCEEVWRTHDQYDTILLLGGWDATEIGPRPTIAEAMRTWLLNKDPTLEKKIFLPLEPPHRTTMPPRDTAEECMLLSKLFGNGFFPKTTTDVDAIVVGGLGGWAFRVWRTYRYLEVPVRNVLGVDSNLSTKARLQNIKVALASIVDPLGIGMFRKQFQNNRAKRTLDHSMGNALLPPFRPFPKL